MSKTPEKTLRADARRNLDTLLEAAKLVFATSGIDAPVREIAAKAGVGVATVYRHFPERADLIAAVFRREVDACAAAAPTLAAAHEPLDALTQWLHRYTSLIATKRGLAEAFHSDDPALEPLAAYFQERLDAALASLLDAAIGAGVIRADVAAVDILRAVGGLATASGRHMVDVLIDGLRFGAKANAKEPRTPKAARRSAGRALRAAR